MVPAAGLGTRLRPLTYITPKEMIRLVDKPIFEYLFAEAYEAGIRKIIFIIHRDNQALKKFIASADAKPILEQYPGLAISFVITNKRGGDGQAIYEARKLLTSNEPFALSMGDLLSLPGKSILKELIDVYLREKNPIISVAKVPRADTMHYGVIAPRARSGRRYEVEGIVEKPTPEEAPSTLAMTGKYVLTSQIFSYLQKIVKKPVGKEARIADALNLYAKDKKLFALDCVNKYYDTGTKPMLLKTEFIFALNDPRFKKDMQAFLKKK